MLLVNNGFVNDAHSASSSKGVPGIRIIGTPIECESTVEADVEAGIEGAMDKIITELTRPLTQAESNPQPKTEAEPRFVFKGSNRDVNNFFYRKGWTDGLPIIPPTEAAVAEMLTGTDLPADHIVAKLIPRKGHATVEKIAINAVMAGALPVHMPVIIAAIDALSDGKTRFDTFEVSTGSWAPFFLINGPVRTDIHINSSSGAASPGNIANAAIGRAIALVVKNIGGARKGIEDMGTLGNTMKWSLVIGENEEESPWEPYHVSSGFQKEESVLTVFFPNQYTVSIPGQTHAEGVATSLANMRPGALSALLVIPAHAKILASEGWDKQRVKDFIIERNRPAPKVGSKVSPKAGPEAKTGAAPLPTDAGVFGRGLQNDDFMLVVVGGPGVWQGKYASAGGFNNSFVRRKINLPKNWESLVAKYRNMVPNYISY